MTSDVSVGQPPHEELITSTLRVLTWNVWGRFGPWQAREAALINTLPPRRRSCLALFDRGRRALRGGRAIRPLRRVCRPALLERALVFVTRQEKTIRKGLRTGPLPDREPGRH